MSRKIGKRIFIIESEKPQQCDMCGKIAELRPYGPPEKQMICIDCGNKDPEGTLRRFHQRLFGE